MYIYTSLSKPRGKDTYKKFGKTHAAPARETSYTHYIGNRFIPEAYMYIATYCIYYVYCINTRARVCVFTAR